MWTLIRREWKDARVVVLGMSILVALSAVTIISSVWYEYVIDSRPPIGIPVDLAMGWFSLILALLPLGFNAMGNYQMRGDRKNKISTYLCTLQASRRKIYLSRVVSGLLCVIFATLVLIVTTAITFRLFPRLIAIDSAYLWRMAAMLFCLSWAGYSLGLQTGWSNNKYLTSLGGAGLTILVMSMVMFKGIANESLILLTVISTLALIRAWYKYSESSL
jgi:ABC-type transport system involved in multi-copper enzyme maturation permease subunit